MNGFSQDSYQSPARLAKFAGLARNGSGRHKVNRRERRELVADLRRFSWFDDVDDSELERLSAEVSRFRYPANWAIAPSGTVLEFCWFITEGTARVMRQGVEVSRLGAGDIVGEPAFQRARTTRTSVVTVTPIEGIAVAPSALRTLKRSSVDFAAKRSLVWSELPI